jgi:pimeloyl-ACP methyl ester carboxylesterase
VNAMKKLLGSIFKITGAIVLLLIAAIVFFYAQSTLREKKTRHEAAPSAGKFILADDVEIFIQELGPVDGQAIIFIHGTGGSSELWLETMTRFANAGYRCVGIDIPPFGFSETPSTPSYGNVDQAKRIIALMDALEIEHAILFGHSFGGGATMETALMIPDRIDGLILLDVGGLNLNMQPAPKPASPSALEWFMSTKAIRNPVLSATATNTFLTKTLISAMLYDPADATDEKVAILQQPLVLQGATDTLGDWLQYVLTVQQPSLSTDPANYQTLDMPALIVWGDSDTIIPLSDGEYLESILPNAELVVMKNVNHVPYLEDLDGLMEIVMEFLGK